MKIVVALLTGMIRTYQWTLSAVTGPTCRFEPTCSAYTEEAIRRHGPAAGLWLGLARLLRCHPWSAGGYDPVPERPAGRRTGTPHGHAGPCGH